MIRNLDDNEVPLAAIADNRVQEPPERRQILHEKVL